MISSVAKIPGSAGVLDCRPEGQVAELGSSNSLSSSADPTLRKFLEESYAHITNGDSLRPSGVRSPYVLFMPERKFMDLGSVNWGGISTKRFFEELGKFAGEKFQDPSQREYGDRFLAKMASSQIIYDLSGSVPEKIFAFARLTRQPLIERHFAARVLDLIEFEFDSAMRGDRDSDPSSSARIIEESLALFAQDSVPAQLDYIQQLKSLIARWIDQGDHGEERVTWICKPILTRIVCGEFSPLVTSLADAALRDVSLTTEHVVLKPPMELRAHGRNRYRAFEPEVERCGRIARNEIGIRDFAGRLVSICSGMEGLDSASSVNTAQRLLESIVDLQGTRKLSLFLSRLNQVLNLLSDEKLCDRKNPDSAAEYLHTLSGSVSSSLWRKIVLACNRYDAEAQTEKEQRIRSRLHCRVGNLQAISGFLECFDSEFGNEAAILRLPQSKLIQDQYLAYQRVDNNDLEERYRLACRVIEALYWPTNFGWSGESIESSDLVSSLFPRSLRELENCRAELSDRAFETWNFENGDYFFNARPRVSRALAHALPPTPIMAREIVNSLSVLQLALRKKATGTVMDIGEVSHSKQLCPFESVDSAELPVLLQTMHHPDVRAFFEADLGIQLNEISWRSQIHFLRFLCGKDCRIRYEELKSVLRSPGSLSNQIAESFLANAEDAQYAEAILRIAEELPEEKVRVLLGKYLKICERAEEIEQFVIENCGGVSTGAKTGEMARNLLHRANELLLTWSREPRIRKDEGVEVLLKSLSQVDEDVILFGAVFKTLKKTEIRSITDLQSTKIITLNGDELPDNLREAMKAISFENTRQYPAKLAETFHEHLRHALHDPQEKFYLLTTDGKIAAFVRFTPQPDGSVYFGSFNASPSAKGLGIGDAFLCAILEKLNGEHEVQALSWENTPALGRYLNLGFKIVETDRHSERTGATVHRIVLRKGEYQRRQAHLKVEGEKLVQAA